LRSSLITVLPQLDDFHRHASSDRFDLLGQVHDPHATFPHLLQELVWNAILIRDRLQSQLPFLRMMGYHDRLFLSTYRRQDDQWDFSRPFCR
jgi:hypothetical protein